ncbi:ABC transporter [Prauserella sp. PE36]|uniref:Transport permease protein n=1 Tax=Prauserella endophytica TaxID=1592324 RepID=A0ABY2SBZ0_9PSEU|nr:MULTISPECIES: ABC transporter permease [Prauserella]PXY34821.1 ABC transporter [Prauserella coralliicola]RBM24274.1 ABC transporter [Prauserella sp. PE36]TKG73345.1 ABC transporter permease [Prauserella endophytica]
MNPTAAAIRAGIRRGRIELRQTFTNFQDLWGYLFPAVALLVVMTLMRGSTIPGTEFSRGTMTLPSVLGVSVAFSSLVNLAQILTIEREDGTLLRAKAVPGGMLGYLVGKIVMISGTALINVAIVLVPGVFLFAGLDLGDVGAWLTLLWVLVLGLVATMPLGAIVGSLFPNARNLGAVMLPIMGLVAISGIFYPITGFPEWLQWIAQVFPIYWLGLGMRSALLPDGMQAVEISESWRHWETAGVLGVWAVIGLVVAPMVLRRMARRESGSSVAARREKALQRIA